MFSGETKGQVLLAISSGNLILGQNNEITEHFYRKQFLKLVMRKSLSLLLILSLTISSLLMLSLASAETKPLIPQFTLKIVNHTYQIASISSTDPFTGKITTSPGGNIDWQTLDITITNQKYDGKQVNEYGLYSGFLYFVRYKGHYAVEWNEEPATNNFYFPYNSTSQYTLASFVLNQAFEHLEEDGVPNTYVTPHSFGLPAEGQVDFQVEALIGNLTQQISFGRPLIFTGQQSGWSSTQTLSINDGSATIGTISDPTPSQSTPNLTGLPTPTQSTWLTQNPNTNPSQLDGQPGILIVLGWEETAIIFLILLVAVLLVVVGVLLRKKVAK
jgi:hypothetical protein